METMKMHPSLSNPKAVAETGEKIYRDRYQLKLEAENFGKFVVIDVSTEEAIIGDSPEDAMNSAREKLPNGVFHLIRIGSPGAFRVGYSNTTSDWLFQ